MYSVIKGAGYVLVNTPQLVETAGATFTTEKILNPDSDLLKNVQDHLRSFDEVVNYLPNQIYIGNATPDALADKKLPYTEIENKGTREGKFGIIVPEEEFIGLLKYADEFDLVFLSEDYVNEFKSVLEERYPEFEKMFPKLKGQDISKAEELIANDKAVALYHDGKLYGYVRAAHDTDVNLSAHTMLENLVSKASGALAAIETLRVSGIDRKDINYVIECSEEAAGDINQRGGGNIAKSIAEMCGLENANGSDVRGFCAAPVHALVTAASHVRGGTFKNVLVVAGGSTAKLGMNARDHINKGLPILEDCVAGFGVIVSQNDGVSPIIRNDIVGTHKVSTGSSPQAVISSLVYDPLHEHGLKFTDVDKYSPEMQNPDITKPAGAGNVPEANYKMIAALAVTKGELDKKELKNFIEKHGLHGWAPTQGHIPSAVPYVGHMIHDLTDGDLNRAMLIGKGSLFLGRLTNLFDGVSVIVERNTGKDAEAETGLDQEMVRKLLAEAMKKVASDILERE